jgi:LacI family kdg operon repressor
MRKVTMADVAKNAEVSKSTVSQFLNERYEYMSLETKKRIEAAIKELGYQPNYVARSLKQKRTSTIGVIVANIMHRVSTEVSRAIEDFFHEHSIHVILCNADDDPEKERKYIDVLRAKQVDGLIIFPTGGNLDLYQQMEREKYPVVFMDRKIKGVSIDTVVPNNREASHEAVKHLIELGHERIAAITPPLTISPRSERLEGYHDALKEYDISPCEAYVKSVDIHHVKSELEHMFSLADPPTALLAANDLVSMEVLDFLKERNLAIAADVALIVFDNLAFASIFQPSITTVSQPAFQMGEKAAELLFAKMEQKEADRIPSEHVFPCELMIRESSGKSVTK